MTYIMEFKPFHRQWMDVPVKNRRVGVCRKTNTPECERNIPEDSVGGKARNK